MEKNHSKAVSQKKYETLDESLEKIFDSMISQGDVLDAIDFIRSLDISFLPSKTVMHTIIFEILMKHDGNSSLNDDKFILNDEKLCLAWSSDYLVTVLKAFPPCNEELREFYYHSIRNRNGFLADLWTLFNHIVNSFFYHRKIYTIDKDVNSPDPVKFPNCKFLLEFYVKLFTVDFEYCDPKSSRLVVRLLWPGGNICLCNRTEQLLKWINDIYSTSFVNSVGDLLESMHDMLILMVKAMIQDNEDLSDSVTFSNPCLTEIVEAIVNFCKNAFDNHSNVKLFLNLLSFQYLQARVSEKIVKMIVKQSSKRPHVQTLQDIVDQYMFPKKFNKWRNSKSYLNREMNLRKRSVDKKASVTDKKITMASNKTTKLHKCCKESKFGDLLQILLSSCENVNVKDYAGCTPLHVACQVGSFPCTKILIEETDKTPYALDFAATNLEGFTALHIAVMNNFIDIARQLLRFGGSELLTITDNKGLNATDYCCSGEMNNLLQEYQPEFNSADTDITTDNKFDEAPKLKSFKEYSIYLHALNCLLCSYCNIFNLYEFVWKGNSVVQSHKDELCCHYQGQDICSEDAAVIFDMPALIETFIESLLKNVSVLEVNIDIELIPLKCFAASLKAS